jgi:hypothetical protein
MFLKDLEPLILAYINNNKKFAPNYRGNWVSLSKALEIYSLYL